MFGKKNCADLSKINSYISPGNTIAGEFEFSGTVKFGGTLTGSMIGTLQEQNGTPSVAIVEGQVHGKKIEADHVIIIGDVNVETLVAHRTLVINKTAVVNAETILYNELSTEQGAKISGCLKQIEVVAKQ